jgi:hypothetical protein
MTTPSDVRFAEISARLSEFHTRLHALEVKLGLAEPPPKPKSTWQAPNRLDQLSVPRDVTDAMVRAVPDGLVRTVVADKDRKGFGR